MKAKYIIFDLDDTLMYEIDFLKSAFKEIADFIDKKNQEELFKLMLIKYHEGENVFDFLINNYTNFSKEQLLQMYRNHFPNISLNEGTDDLLKKIKSKGYKLGLITDGRSVTQRNKLKALEIENLFDRIVISEEFGSMKPNESNFKVFQEPEIDDYFYIGDNTKKDFVTPNKLGWTSICILNKGFNIHKQDFNLDQQFLPQLKINSLSELLKL
ncbi:MULTISPECIES: HAD family hydrolase [Empedobacter]|uniref:HAD family hydrolase n=1 Tax=Empedobacter TaxID=59734 RepID=UPI0025767C75|nr:MULTISPECIES: HAD-IA family hydrolase [Empedobacter]MDM1042814.1 HAD-IA family hydrolase [Empedobacter brevis]MDM1136744.1 HAD-IA family hydrolase [Empedobacter sp. R750]